MADWKTEAAERKGTIAATLENIGLTVESKFVPFSRSRNKAEKYKSLNWKISVKRNGREVLATDYSAGIAHCPGYSRKIPQAWDRPARYWQPLICEFECEEGFAAGPYHGWMNGFRADRKSPILPDPVNVMHSLVMDSDVLNHSSFESWASDCGYDTDSRQAESIYRACLEIALKMRAAIGESGMEMLSNAYQDY